ncbi:Molybdate-anion transporter [Boothiomyces macroporosus]|uniref:Molybdate-anion transporter n=1 Tax=Boothiomyces macroporosus TaxID=261099 RepID=A0AAD5UMV5_9FUNG|nr:Molybdate-anion transporter [Boothiomyces macroporosus]
MKDKKKRKVSLKKRQKAEAAYNSDSDAEEFTKQDLIDNDILQEDDLDHDFSEDNISLSDDDEFKEKKEKQPKKDAAEVEEGKTTKLSSVISKILETGVKTDRPVLSLKRKIEKDIDEEKLEERAKKLLSTDKKREKDIGRVIPDNTDLDYEKSLRKMATKGGIFDVIVVVQLFNALRAAQKSVSEVENDGVLKNVDAVPAVSKETFIKTLKQEKEKTNAEAVPFLREDYGMTAPKHWDEEDDEMQEELQLDIPIQLSDRAALSLLRLIFKATEKPKNAFLMNEQSYLGLLLASGLICALLYYYNNQSADTSLIDNQKHKSLEYQYFTVYALVMLSDWLQGSYLYELYKSYGYDLHEIAILFVVGFMSAGFAGPLVGNLSDRLGRKIGCISFCFLYALSCATKLSSNFQILVLGRVTGGVSTSLLMTVFESWVIEQHKSLSLDERSLSIIFSKSTLINSLVAILSGLIANAVVSSFGLVSPFIISGGLLLLAGLLIYKLWPEHYKTTQESSASIKDAFRVLMNDSSIIAIGFVQSCFESSMYIFVFLWTPVMNSTLSDTAKLLPLGVIFSTLMVSIMIGSTIFSYLSSKKVPAKSILQYATIGAVVSFTGLAATKSELVTFILLNVFEMCCGVYFPSFSTVRSFVIPEQSRSTIMNICRVPLNLVVVLVLAFINQYPPYKIFLLCSVFNGISYFIIAFYIPDHEAVFQKIADEL